MIDVDYSGMIDVEEFSVVMITNSVYNISSFTKFQLGFPIKLKTQDRNSLWFVIFSYIHFSLVPWGEPFRPIHPHAAILWKRWEEEVRETRVLQVRVSFCQPTLKVHREFPERSARSWIRHELSRWQYYIPFAICKGDIGAHKVTGNQLRWIFKST